MRKSLFRYFSVLAVLATTAIGSRSLAVVAPQCAHLFWQLTAEYQTPPEEAQTAIEASALRYAAAEFLYLNKNRADDVKDPRAVALFKSIAAGEVTDPKKLLNTGMYDSLFLSLRDHSNVIPRLESEKNFVTQCRESLIASQTTLWDLPASLDDFYIEPKVFGQSMSLLWAKAFDHHQLSLEEVQGRLAGVRAEKKVSLFKKILRQGIQPITIAEAIRLSHLIADEQQNNIMTDLIPFIFNDFSFYTPLDALAMLKTLNPQAMATLLESFSFKIDARSLDLIRENPNTLQQLTLVAFAVEIDSSHLNLPALIKTEKKLEVLSFYFILYAKAQNQTNVRPFIEGELKAQNFTPADTTTVFETFDSAANFAQRPVEQSNGKKDSDFQIFLTTMNAVTNPTFRLNKINEFLNEKSTLSDNEFVDLYTVFPQDVNWGVSTNGWVPLTNAMKDAGLTSWDGTGFAPREILNAWKMFKKITRVENEPRFTRTYNLMLTHLNRVLSAQKNKVEFNSEILDLFRLDYARIMDPKRTPRK